MSEAAGPRAIILSVGTELTEGIVLNTHLRYLGAELKKLGLPVTRAIQIPDRLPLFRAELKRAVEESELVIVTGGLGPTSDDLTREAAAEAAGVPLVFQPPLWEALERRFAGRRISETNRKQAMVPRGFQALPNELGTAPGLLGAIGDALVACLPGPPRELAPMFQNAVVPALRGRFALAAAGELEGTALMVPESELEEGLREAAEEGVRWGTRFSDDRITFTLLEGTAQGREAVLARLAERFGAVRIRRSDVSPARLLFEALRGRGERIALAESCTGGLLGKLLTDLAGSSEVLWGGLVAYSNQAKERLLGVDSGLIDRCGAVSREAAEAMAGGALARSGVEASLAVTGIAGPAGGTPEKPVGTVWIAALHRDGTALQRRFRFSGDRDAVRRRAAVAAFLIAETVVARKDWLDSWPES